MLRLTRALARSPALTRQQLVRQPLRGMQTGFVVVATGPDRVGVVRDLTDIIRRSGGSVGDSQSMSLRETFTVAMEVGLEGSLSRGALATDLLGKLQAELPSYTVSVRAEEAVEQPRFTARFEVALADDVGVLHDVASIFAKHSLNIASLSTSQELGAFGGTTLFAMEGEVTSLREVDAEAVLDTLSALAETSGSEVVFLPYERSLEHAEALG